MSKVRSRHRLDPHLDFRDDGGTRAWRANQATWGRIIEPQPRGFRACWNSLNLLQQIVLIFAVVWSPLIVGAVLLVLDTIWRAL
jgi:hypothetical protein